MLLPNLPLVTTVFAGGHAVLLHYLPAIMTHIHSLQLHSSQSDFPSTLDAMQTQVPYSKVAGTVRLPRAWDVVFSQMGTALLRLPLRLMGARIKPVNRFGGGVATVAQSFACFFVVACICHHCNFMYVPHHGATGSLNLASKNYWHATHAGTVMIGI